MTLHGDPKARSESARKSFAPANCPTAPKRRAAARELAEFMSEISEAGLASGWDTGLEYSLWGVLWHGYDSPYFRLNQPERRRLGRLSRLAGGWFKWVDGNGFDNPVFVPEAEWVREFRAHEREARS